MDLTFVIIAIVVIATTAQRSWAVREGTRDEYRGWRKFRSMTGTWPVWSMVNAVLSLPVVFGLGAYGFVAALETGGLLLIYSYLVLAGVLSGLLWFTLRSLARYADISRAQRVGTGKLGAKTLNGFLR
ncbi:MAG TPA: hypothetical protein VD837_03345 [Terriglobales bacterium]|nr:hypothetical protein [Terriglobales bacterium]